jgi:hypothetical protein
MPLLCAGIMLKQLSVGANPSANLDSGSQHSIYRNKSGTITVPRRVFSIHCVLLRSSEVLGASRRLRKDGSEPFHNPVKEGLPTIRQNLIFHFPQSSLGTATCT